MGCHDRILVSRNTRGELVVRHVARIQPSRMPQTSILRCVILQLYPYIQFQLFGQHSFSCDRLQKNKNVCLYYNHNIYSMANEEIRAARLSPCSYRDGWFNNQPPIPFLLRVELVMHLPSIQECAGFSA